LSDATEIYNKLAIAATEIGLEINADKTKLLIQTEKLRNWKRESLDTQVWRHHLKEAKAQLWVAAPQEKMISPERQLTVMLTSNTSNPSRMELSPS
jgi:hypothetical protein